MLPPANDAALPAPVTTRRIVRTDVDRIARDTGLDPGTVQTVLDAFAQGGHKAFAQQADTQASSPGGAMAPVHSKAIADVSFRPGQQGATEQKPRGVVPQKPIDFTAPGRNVQQGSGAFSYTSKAGNRINLQGPAATAARERLAANVRGGMPNPTVMMGQARTSVSPGGDAQRSSTPPKRQGDGMAPSPGGSTPPPGLRGGPQRRGFTSPEGVNTQRPVVTTPPERAPRSNMGKIAPGQERKGIGPQVAQGFERRIGSALATLRGGNIPSALQARYQEKLRGMLNQGNLSIGELMRQLGLTRSEARQMLSALQGDMV